MSIKINPGTLTTVSASGKGAVTTTVLAADANRRPYIASLHIDMGDHTSATLDVAGTAIATFTADAPYRSVLVVGAKNEIIEVTFAGGTAGGGFSVTCGYLADPASDTSRDLT